MPKGTPKPKTLVKPKGATTKRLTIGGLTVSQTKAVEALLRGSSFKDAAIAAGVSVVTLQQWREQNDVFRERLAAETKALEDRITRARKALIDKVIATGAAGASRLLQHVQSANPAQSLSASKAAYAGAVALAKGSDADVSNVGPMFVLPPGTVMSLDTSIPALPSPVVEAQVVTAQADKLQANE